MRALCFAVPLSNGPATLTEGYWLSGGGKTCFTQIWLFMNLLIIKPRNSEPNFKLAVLFNRTLSFICILMLALFYPSFVIHHVDAKGCLCLLEWHCHLQIRTGSSLKKSDLPPTLLITEFSFIINVHMHLHSNRIKAQFVSSLFLSHTTIHYPQVNIHPRLFSSMLFTLLIGSSVIGQLPSEDVLISNQSGVARCA